MDIYFFKPTKFLLIIRLLVLELIIVFLYLLIRIPKSFVFFVNFDPSIFSQVYWLGTLYFLFLSLAELILVCIIVLNWANEVWEIRQGILFHRRGIFKLIEDTYSLKNIGSVTISQSFLGRLLNYGTIVVYSPILKQEFFITNIENPKKFVKTLEDEISGLGDKRDIIPRRK